MTTETLHTKTIEQGGYKLEVALLNDRQERGEWTHISVKIVHNPLTKQATRICARRFSAMANNSIRKAVESALESFDRHLVSRRKSIIEKREKQNKREREFHEAVEETTTSKIFKHADQLYTEQRRND